MMPDTEVSIAGWEQNSIRCQMFRPFYGSGTNMVAEQKLNCKSIDIDVTHLAVGLQKLRLRDSLGLNAIGEKAASPSSLKGTHSSGKFDAFSVGEDCSIHPSGYSRRY